MQYWNVLDEGYSGHENFSITEFIENELALDNLSSIEIHCRRWVLDRVLHEIPCRIEYQTELSGDLYLIKGQAYSLEWLANWLISLGTCVEVINPDKLKNLVKHKAQNIMQIYT